MKKTTLLFTAFVFFIVASCIRLPSLHSIVNDENRITDDRLVGDWLLIDEYFLEDFPIKFETNDAADLIDGVQSGMDILEANGQSFKEFVTKDNAYTTWKFERAAKLEFEYAKLPEGTVAWSASEIGGEKSSLEEIRKRYDNNDIVVKEKKELPYYILTSKKVDDFPVEIKMKVELTKINGDIYMDIFPMNLEVAPERFAANFIGAHTFVKLVFKEGKWMIYTFDGDGIRDLIKTKRLRLKHEIVVTTKQEGNKVVTEENFILTASTAELRAFLEKYGNDESLYANIEGLIKYDE